MLILVLSFALAQETDQQAVETRPEAVEELDEVSDDLRELTEEVRELTRQVTSDTGILLPASDFVGPKPEADEAEAEDVHEACEDEAIEDTDR